MNRFLSPKKIAGFSTPEVLLSTFVLAIGLVAIVATLAGTLRYSQYNRDVIIASELAQEGVELVRNIRDNDSAAGNSGFTSFSTTNQHCRIDWNDTALSCAGTLDIASRYALTYSNGTYSHNNSAGKFSRYIYVNYTSGTTGNNRASVRSYVYWGANNHPNDLSTNTVTNCTLDNNCVFSEVFLTEWR